MGQFMGHDEIQVGFYTLTENKILEGLTVDVLEDFGLLFRTSGTMKTINVGQAIFEISHDRFDIQPDDMGLPVGRSESMGHFIVDLEGETFRDSFTEAFKHSLDQVFQFSVVDLVPGSRSSFLVAMGLQIGGHIPFTRVVSPSTVSRDIRDDRCTSIQSQLDLGIVGENTTITLAFSRDEDHIRRGVGTSVGTIPEGDPIPVRGRVLRSTADELGSLVSLGLIFLLDRNRQLRIEIQFCTHNRLNSLTYSFSLRGCSRLNRKKINSKLLQSLQIIFGPFIVPGIDVVQQGPF